MKSHDRWLYFAEEDHHVAEIALKDQIYNQVCFHAQQGVEKLLKAFLKFKGGRTPRTHFIRKLLQLCAREEKSFAQLQPMCRRLDRYYLPTRYPDALVGSLPEGLPDEAEAKRALALLERVRRFVHRKVLGRRSS